MIIKDSDDLLNVCVDPERLGMYYIYDKVAEVPVTQLMLCKNSASARLGFYEFCLERKKNNLNPKNYSLMISGFVKLPYYLVDKDIYFENTVEVVDGENVYKSLLDDKILLADVEDVQPTAETEIKEIVENE